ncbi:MAG TPA: hypothetical protein EYG68_06390 [Leucothrix mucor]|nr:hypothetical protein [Leucothrix mucor]
MNVSKVELSLQQLEVLHNDPFYKAYKGSFSGVLRWSQLDELWLQVVKNKESNWFVYAVGEVPPEKPVVIDEVEHFIQEVDQLLRREHDEDYCGIVYANNIEEPTFIKIYDPSNLGTACGSSGTPPLPGWVLSKIKPVDLPSAFPQPNNRKRWWESIFR